MKSLITFLSSVLAEAETQCHVSTTLDGKTIKRRVEHEGLSFLTITLPTFGKDFQKSLDQMYVSDDLFVGFQRTGGLPRLFSGFLRLVFDSKSGRLLDAPSIDAIFWIRQLTLMFEKMSDECSNARNQAALKRYVECENELRRAPDLNPSDSEGFSRIARLLWSDLFQLVDEDIYYGRLTPKHGPGKTADRLNGNAKWTQHVWPERLQEEFCFSEFLVPSQRYTAEASDRIMFVEPGSETPVRVVTVPKTLKTPRIIAIEPTAMQYAQQAILGSIVEHVEELTVPRELIGFLHQEPNRLLAEKGSRDGSLATLDMKEASDRVSNQHVRLLLKDFPNLFRAVDSCRSRKADVRGFGVYRLAKFASMGSALCFPFEAIVFMTLVFLGIERELNRPLTKDDIQSFLGQVRVYGDDIIVPVEFVSSVSTVLGDFGHQVNVGKSFWNGKFRESCGGDYYDGIDITVIRLRSGLPSSLKHSSEIVSTISTRNQFYLAGHWKIARYLDNLLQGFVPLPDVYESSQLLGRITLLNLLNADYSKWDDELHVPLVKGLVVHAPIPESPLDGYPALLKCLAKRGDLPFADAKHLENAGRPLRVTLKQRWSSPF